MENIEVLAGWLVFLTIGASFPMLYLWASGKFVKQKAPPKHARAIVLAVTTLGIGYSILLAIGETGFGSLLSLVLSALLAGSGITAIVAIQESFEDNPQGSAE